MSILSMLEAESKLSQLVEAIEHGTETEIVITRNGRPAARLVTLKPSHIGKRIVVAKGKFTVPESIDSDNDMITALFNGDATHIAPSASDF